MNNNNDVLESIVELMIIVGLLGLVRCALEAVVRGLISLWKTIRNATEKRKH